MQSLAFGDALIGMGIPLHLLKKTGKAIIKSLKKFKQ